MAIMAAIWMKKKEKRSATVVLVSGNSMWIDDCTMRAARTATASAPMGAGATCRDEHDGGEDRKVLDAVGMGAHSGRRDSRRPAACFQSRTTRVGRSATGLAMLWTLGEVAITAACTSANCSFVPLPLMRTV